MTRAVQVEVVCPKCTRKAIFHSILIGRYVMHPDINGRVTCAYCGFNGIHTFSKKDYYYQIEIGDRTLFARTFEQLMFYRNYFNYKLQEKPRHDPNSDFPKIFYKKRKEIVEKIDQFLRRK